jgi:hypothetical protein
LWILFGIARTIDLLELHEDIAECKLLHIRPNNQYSNLQRAIGEKSGWNAISSSIDGHATDIAFKNAVG